MYGATSADFTTTAGGRVVAGASGIAIGLNTLGFTWAVNDVVSVNGTYEIA